jgi:hypothetical protein
MLLIKVFKIAAILVLLLLSSALFAQTPAEAEAAAREALRRLEANLGGGSAGNVSTGTGAGAGTGTQTQRATPAPATPAPPVPSVQVTTGGTQPRWVADPYTLYDRNLFLAAVGSGVNRSQAEARAFAALVAIFGQSVRAEFTATTMYEEAINRGVVNVSENTSVRDQITTAASMDRLVGAEVGGVWDSGRGTVHAVVYMNKARAISIYTDMIILNLRNINMLTTMSNAERNTLDGFARFRLAGQIAGINSNYAGIIAQLGGSTDSLNLLTPDFYNLQATEIIRNVTVVVTVTNDRANRIQDAFARVLSAEGLRTRGNDPRYTLEVRLSVGEVSFPGNPNVFCRIEGSANLIDNRTGASLFPFSFNDRVGHTTFANAEQAAYTSVERIIAQRYPAALRDYLASLIPLN